MPSRPGCWRICHIVTASISSRAADRSWAAEPWLAEEERQLQGHGFLCESLDLAGWPGPDLAEHLASFDVLYVQGGNTFYLLEQMRRSGADEIIQELVAAHGVVHCGVSAGSIVAGPDIAVAGWSPDWDRNEVGLTDLTGLRLVPFILSPHYVAQDAALIAAKLPLPHPLLALRDGQAWVVDGENQYLIGQGEIGSSSESLLTRGVLIRRGTAFRFSHNSRAFARKLAPEAALACEGKPTSGSNAA